MEQGKSSAASASMMTSHPTDVHHSLKRSKTKKRRNICLGIIAVILLLALIILILALTVFKAKRPVITVNSVSLDNFGFKFDLASLRLHLNITLDVDISIKNPNKVGFKYTNTSSFLKFKDQVIGEVPLPAGKIKSDGSTPLNVTLTVMADRLLFDAGVYSDIIGGTLPLTTSTRISGKVRILKLFNIHVVSYSICDLNIDTTNRGPVNQTCHYKNKY